MRGERGPEIAHWQHWLVDSSIAFVGLLPPLAVLIPLSGLAAARIHQAIPAARPAVLRTAALGMSFAFVTAAGPVAHDVLVGENTWLADRVTLWLGSPESGGHAVTSALATSAGQDRLADIGVQVALGIPVYTALVAGALLLVCRRTCGRQRDVIDLRGVDEVAALRR